jgi:hypothetical protein
MPSGVYNRTSVKMSVVERKNKASRRQREYYAKNEIYRRRQKDLKLRKAYGITLEQYETWNACNNGLCHICNKAEIAFDKKANRLRMLAVDHDETTGLVRGLLCSVCNRGIGMLRHNINVLKEAVDYINYFNNVTVVGVKSAFNEVA